MFTSLQDVLIEVIDRLDVPSILSLRLVSKELEQLTRLRVVWVRQYRASRLSLPPGPSNYQSTTQLEHHLFRAMKLDENFSSLTPAPTSISHVASETVQNLQEIKLVGDGRFLVEIGTTRIAITDLEATGVSQPWTIEIAPNEPFVVRATKVKGQNSILVARAIPSEVPGVGALSYAVEYLPISADCNPCQVVSLPAIHITSPIIGMDVRDSLIAIACDDGDYILHDMNTGRQSIIGHNPDVENHFSAIKMLPNFLLVIRLAPDSTVFDLYNLPTMNRIPLCEQATKAPEPALRHVLSGIPCRWYISARESEMTSTGPNTRSIAVFASADSPVGLTRYNLEFPSHPIRQSSMSSKSGTEKMSLELDASWSTIPTSRTRTKLLDIGDTGLRAISLAQCPVSRRRMLRAHTIRDGKITTGRLNIACSDGGRNVVNSASVVAFDETSGRLCIGTENGNIYKVEYA